ncbi:cation:proton antiporter domain-containing protein [Pontibacter akesuensis]|uniref:Transporter, CPA2 family n=1 Tax=Pontibacter akesuensis TaxID=388950 RepID=A0A1I7HU11_9BACT|nr:cation:proton antiporter [Pontibacter akesuensis]GHA63557.1 sodium:proton antiporter [Pontibacter akesuensis]SFU64183.1 transporter, CPA2 family [Pontibacter akesuensis]
MTHLPHLVTDLALILVAAGITTLIFKKLKQPLVLGYIIAGLLVGPHIALFPSVMETENITIWAEIGVIFLLFSLGLEFSFKKLVKVGGASSVMALIEVVVMLLLGYFTGKILGWNTMDSIFLGGILSISSTTIIIRAFEELGVKSHKFAGLVFGVLIVEDLVAILLLVLLSTLAVSQQFAGTEMLAAVMKLAFFLLLWFLAGIFLIPTFLRRASKLMNNETLLIVSLALCLLMVVLAAQVGFSPALGAFIMGSILAETTKAEKIEHLVSSVKDLFGAIFFVSVGMLINPATLVDYAGPIALITVVTLVGKALSITGGGLISGQGLKTSIQSGMSVSQIGEFSFIIATLGLTLNVTSDFLYPVAVAVSAVTTFTTPYMIRLSEPLYRKVEAMLPAKWLASLNEYSSGAQTISTTSDWKLVLRTYIVNLVIYSVIIIGIVMLSARYLNPFVTETLINGNLGDIVTTAITLVFMAPFLWALAVYHPQKEAQGRIWANKNYRSLIIVLEFGRIVIAILFIGFLLNQFFSVQVAFIGGFLIIGVLAIFSQRIQNFYIRIETRFMNNLNAREISDAAKMHHTLTPWNAHLTSFEIAAESAVAGHNLVELQVREKYGVNVAVIERGDRTIMAPTRNERIFPGDKLYVFGTDEQIETFREFIRTEVAPPTDGQNEREDVGLEKLLVKRDSMLLHKTIRQAGVREKTHGLIVGIEKNGERYLNPDSDMVFEEGDMVWIVGSPSRIKMLEEARQEA